MSRQALAGAQDGYGESEVRDLVHCGEEAALNRPSGCLPKGKVGYRADRSSLCRRTRHNSLNEKQGRFQLGMWFFFHVISHYEDNYTLALAAESHSRQKCSVSAEETQQFYCLPLDTLLPEFHLLSSSPPPKKGLLNSISISTCSCITTKCQKVWKATRVGKQPLWSTGFFPLPAWYWLWYL